MRNYCVEMQCGTLLARPLVGLTCLTGTTGHCRPGAVRGWVPLPPSYGGCVPQPPLPGLAGTRGRFCGNAAWLTRWALHRAGGDGAGELGVVPLVLVGVQAGEAADRGGELGGLPDVGIYGHRVAGSGVGASEGLAARGRELDQAGSDQVGGRDDLHVAELPDVIVPPVERAPAGENVGGALDQPFAADHPLAVAAVATRPGIGLVYGRSSLLDLQEQWVDPGSALQQHQVDLHAHAAYAHDLADHVDRGEPVEQAPPVLLQGNPVLGQEVVDQVVLLIVADRDADGRVLGDPGAPVRHRGELGERSPARAALALLLDVNRGPPAVSRLEVADQVVDVRAVVPDVEFGHGRVP